MMECGSVEDLTEGTGGGEGGEEGEGEKGDGEEEDVGVLTL